MSYDLMVFDPKSAPDGRKEFLAWVHEQVHWKQGQKYDDPQATTPALRAWFVEMIIKYPAMNGPFASKDSDDPRVSDYSIGKSVIYVAFPWSEARSAAFTAFSSAKRHQVGFFDVSADNGGVWIPKDGGRYVCIHGKEETYTEQTAPKKGWWQMWIKD
jgi:hypothetical protein